MRQLDLLARAAVRPPKDGTLPPVVRALYLGDPMRPPQVERSWPDHDGLRSQRLEQLPTDVLADDRLT